jgi:hypothetical protein
VHDVRLSLLEEILKGLVGLRSSQSGERLCRSEDYVMDGNDFMGSEHPVKSLKVKSRHPSGSDHGHSKSSII